MSDEAGTRPAGLYDAELARPEAPGKAAFWTGWVLGALPSLMMLSGGLMAIFAPAKVAAGTVALGYSPGVLPVLGTVEVVCTVLYLIPRTAALGALLLTAYFGGAVASHVRLGQTQWVVPVVFGVLVWVGLLLRRPGLRRMMVAGGQK